MEYVHCTRDLVHIWHDSREICRVTVRLEAWIGGVETFGDSQSRALRACEFLAVTLRRSLRSSTHAERWLVFDSSSDQLLTLTLFPPDACDAEMNSYMDVYSNELGVAGSLIDVLLDGEVGCALLTNYEPGLALDTLIGLEKLGAGELATLMLGVLSLAARCQTVGLAMYQLAPSMLTIDETGAIWLTSHQAFRHSENDSEGSDLAECGISRETLFDLLSCSGTVEAVSLVSPIVDRTFEASAGESALEVAVHHCTSVVIPRKIQLPFGVGTLRNNASEETTGILRDVRLGDEAELKAPDSPRTHPLRVDSSPARGSVRRLLHRRFGGRTTVQGRPSNEPQTHLRSLMRRLRDA